MKTLRIAYKKNRPQAEFQEDVKSKFLLFSAGYASGKSFGLAMKLMQLSYLNRGMSGGCLVPSLAEFKKDLRPIFDYILDDNQIRARYHKTEQWYKFPWSSGALQIFSAEKSLRGPNLAYAGINEIGQITKESFHELIGRVRVKGAPCPQIAASGTPEGTSHWVYETFVEKPIDNSRIIFGDTRDNLENLSADYIRTLESTYDSVMLDAYMKGLFVNMNSNRFYYAYDPMRNLNKKLQRIPGLEVCISMDFNVDPMTATMWHLIDQRDEFGKRYIDTYGNVIRKATAFDSIELGGSQGADTKQMCNAIKARGYHPDDCTIYPDPAGKARSTSGSSDVVILQQQGFKKIKYRSVAPQFRRRQLGVNNLLEKGLIEINPDTCKGLKKDLESVEQDQVSLGKVKDNPKLTHFSDGMDYFIDLEFPLSGAKPDSRSTKFR